MPFNSKTASEAGKKSKRKGVKNRQRHPDIINAFISTIKSGSFYVYYHIDPFTKEVIYVGKGKNNRAWDFKSRTDVWKDYVNSLGVEIQVRLVCLDLSEEEALAIESALIGVLNPKCNLTGMQNP